MTESGARPRPRPAPAAAYCPADRLRTERPRCASTRCDGATGRRPQARELTEEILIRTGRYMLGDLVTSVIAGLATAVWCAAVGVPYAAALVAVPAAVALGLLAVHRIRYPFPALGLGNAVASAVVLLADSLPWLLALAFALAGRWRAARTTGALAALTSIGLQLREPVHSLWQVYCTAVPAIVGALLLLAPTGLVDATARGRREAAALALGIAVPMIAVLHYEVPLLGTLLLSRASTLTLWQCTVVAVLLLLRLSGRRLDGFRAAGVLLAVLPWLTNLVLAAADSSQRSPVVALYGGACLAPLAGAAALAGAVRVGRRVRANEPSRPA
ncbi:hypothetical protein OU787_27080 [Kitasatospora sp. YST-16]|uniref:hypothetical protein n=1 Tax=Kitasatospora sp. YST-16 TaxID=2998080 RepID=UPI0022842B94|nr:hypothetical protein [Kitasatospora sp. YST-16]WAL74846.1 hypothetical protein OU787_27080 [Kitasatospora sp. YST-16]WNW40902.1 hypothetical protein RKE32_27015 [Streptomyces sp. Li-HN-5-13]